MKIGKLMTLSCVLFSLLFASCIEDELLKGNLYTFKGETITQYVNHEKNLSMFAKMLTISRNSNDSNSSTVASLLGSRGNFTAFIPDNVAMTIYLDSLYGKGNYDIDSIPQDVADKIVLNCVMDFGDKRAWREMQLPEGYCEQSTLNDCNVMIRFGRYGNGIFTKVNNAHIIRHDIDLFNGYVEIMDRVIEPCPQTVTGLIQQTEGMLIFSRLLDLTSWGDSLLAFKDKKYMYRDRGESGPKVPVNRLHAFMAFVEPDEVFHEKWGVPLPVVDEDDGHVENWDAILQHVIEKCQQVYPEATDADMKSPDNAVNTFMAYHLVDGRYDWENLVRHRKNLPDWYTKNIDNFYCTKGKHKRLLKATHVVKDNTIMLNRHSYYNNAFDGDYSEVACDIRGVKVSGDPEDYGYNCARNGYYYTLDDMLLYTNQVRDVVLNGRIRYGAIGFLPELSSLVINKQGSMGDLVPSDFCANFSTDADYTFIESFSGRGIEKYSLSFFPGITDFTMKLMPVPFAGRWQVRMDYNIMYSGMDEVCNVFFGDRRILRREDAVGLPTRNFEMVTAMTEKIFRNDYLLDKDSLACFENDRLLMKHGIMKGPKMYHYIDNLSYDFRDAADRRVNPDLLTMRDNPRVCRKIVYEGYMEPDKEYFVRVQCMVGVLTGPNIKHRVPCLDLIELVPESVFDNLHRAEDIW